MVGPVQERWQGRCETVVERGEAQRKPISNMPTSKFFHIRQLRCLKRASGTTSARRRVFYTMFLRIPPGAESTPKAS